MSEKRRVLVTGAGTGIGRAVALRLAADGFAVAAHCLQHRQNVELLAAEINASGGEASVLTFDVSDPAASENILNDDILKNGAYWGIVSSAGICKDNSFPAMTADEWMKVINTDLNAFYNVLHPCIMPMIRLRKGGRIVVISSVSGIMGNRGQTNYSAAKAGLNAAAKSLALELAKRKITVNSVAPGAVDTGMLPDEVKEHMLAAIPLGRLGSTSEVAGTVSFLFSEDAAYITRQVISVNGGMC